MSPSEPDQDLGPVVSAYPARLLEGWLPAVLILAIGIAAGLLLRRVEPIVLAALAGTGWFSLSLWWTPRRLVLRESGLEVERWFRPAYRLPFDEVSGVFHDYTLFTSVGGTGVTHVALRLVDRSGRGIRLNPTAFRRAEELFPRLWRRCGYPGQQALVAAADRGDPAAFGPVVVTAEGLTIAGTAHRWEAIHRVEVSPRLLIFHVAGTWRRPTVKVARVPFVWGLVGLLQRRRVTLSGFDGLRFER